LDDRGPFVLEAKLTSGQNLKGTLPVIVLEFAGTTVQGMPARVRVEKPPEWSTEETACEIERLPERGIYVIRAWNWTGELKTIWREISVSDQSGRPVVVTGSDVIKARFYCRKNGAPGRTSR